VGRKLENEVAHLPPPNKKGSDISLTASVCAPAVHTCV
jgi:hypothetical protein